MTVTFALAHEIARTISRPQVTKVQKMEVMEEEEGRLNKRNDEASFGRNGEKAKI